MIDYIADQLGLKRMGHEYKGPCPVCGGNDRFHIKAGRTHDVIYHCRQGCQFIEIVKELQDRGIIENDFKPDPNYVSNAQRQEMATDKVFIAMLDNKVKSGGRPSWSEHKRYKLAVRRVEVLEEKLGIKKQEYSF